MPRRHPVLPKKKLPYDILAVGASWGGVEVLMQLIAALPPEWTLPVVIVQHQHPNSGNALQRILARFTALPVIDVEDKDRIKPGHVYIAPANYHLLVERDQTFSLSMDAPVNYSRPSIDVTFVSMARVFHQRCIGMILTGANNDGAEGLKMIKAEGGYGLVQTPASAEAPIMPEAAIAAGAADAVMVPQEMIPHLLQLLHNGIK